MTVDRFFQGYNRGIVAVIACILLGNAVLLLRLWSLQVLQGTEHREAIARQSIRRIRLAPIRGRIFSQDGVPLTDNVPTTNVYFHLHEMRQPGTRGMRLTYDSVMAELDRAGAIMGRTNPVTPEIIKAHISKYAALPLEVFEDLTPYEVARLEEAMPAIPGMDIRTEFKRVYTQGAVGAHIIGFVGKRWANDEEKETYNYFLPEMAGRSGLEQRYDKELGGVGGMSEVLVDPGGFQFTELSRVDAQSGNDLLLNIDSRAQRLAQTLMSGKKGAFVLMDVKTGAIRAMVSAPTYDLSLMDGSYYRELRDSPLKPLQNRALGGDNMPGSIAKPLVAISILENHVNTPDQVVNCPGYYMLGRTRIRCWNHYGHGDVNVVDALQTSCNTYLIDSGMRTGIDHLHETFASAGLGQPTGIELRAVGDAGLLPGRAEILAYSHGSRSWIASDTAFVSIGQGLIGVSPVQAVSYASAIANDGYLMRPQLVYAERDPKGNLQNVKGPVVRGRLAASPETLALVREGMHRAVHGDRPTAGVANTPTIDLAGKTGTAEVGPLSRRRKNTWFICFGPFADPQWAAVVLVEDGGSGGKTAAPIARDFFDHWLGGGIRRAAFDAPASDLELGVVFDSEAEDTALATNRPSTTALPETLAP